MAIGERRERYPQVNMQNKVECKFDMIEIELILTALQHRGRFVKAKSDNATTDDKRKMHTDEYKAIRTAFNKIRRYAKYDSIEFTARI